MSTMRNSCVSPPLRKAYFPVLAMAHLKLPFTKCRAICSSPTSTVETSFAKSGCASRVSSAQYLLSMIFPCSRISMVLPPNRRYLPAPTVF